MKETIDDNSCRYKTNSCNSIRNGSAVVNGNSRDFFNLKNPIIRNNHLFPIGTGSANHSDLEAIFASFPVFRAMYHPEIFPQSWHLPAPYIEPPRVVSFGDQVNNNRQRSSTPLSPPISSSSPSPINGPSETNNNNNNSRENHHETENNNNHVSPKSSAKSKKYVCDICHRSFDYKHVLQNHGRTHTGEKPFICQECSKRFTRDHHLKTHMRLHTGEKPYTCDHCLRKFVQVANLRRHIRVHTGEKPYPCDQCTSKFSDSNQLKAHKLIHLEEKPFACDRCHGRYRRKHHFKGHKCPKNRVPAVEKYADDETAIKNEEQDAIDEDEFRKSCSSDDAVSNDSGISASSSTSRLLRNGYHKTLAQTSTPLSARLSPLPEALNLSVMVSIPLQKEILVQTDPVDLSINSKYRFANNNNSSGSGSAGDTSRSISPMDETNSSSITE